MGRSAGATISAKRIQIGRALIAIIISAFASVKIQITENIDVQLETSITVVAEISALRENATKVIAVVTSNRLLL